MFQLRTPVAPPQDEAFRLSVLASLNLLDTPPEAEFDSLVQIAQHIIGCPMALVSLVDANRQWFKANCGLDVTETSREHAFCAHAIHVDDMLVVPDATADPRFVDNPFVTGDAHIRFYAGVPIRVSLDDKSPAAALGTLCVIDTEPRILSEEDARMLRHLARLAESLIRGRMHVDRAVRYAEERRLDAQRIDRKNRQLWQAERMAGIGSWRMTLGDEKLEWSNQVFVIHGLPFGPVPTVQEAFEYYPMHARVLLSDAIAQALENGQAFELETDFNSATGVRKRIRTMAEIEYDQGLPVAIVGVFQDITARYEMEQKLRRLANQDSLTGLANRAAFTTALDDQMEQARDSGTALALILIDLDGFKQINDTKGHIAGDEVLQGIARRLQAPYLKQCFPARLGGDEFALIVSCDEDCAGIDVIADRLLVALKRPIDITSGSIAVAGTLGISWLEDGLSRGDFIHRADLALYEAKRAGRGVVRVWEAQVSEDGTTGRRRGRRRS